MEFCDVGRHCEFVSCGRHDYLPFYCPDCKKHYCLDHKDQEAHQCSDYQKNRKKEIRQRPKIKIPKYICRVKGCKTTNLVPIYCQKCGEHFCLPHRYPESHQCRAL